MQTNPKRLSNNCLTDTKSNERPPTLTLLRKKRNYSSLYLFSSTFIFNSEENGSAENTTNELSAWPPTTLLLRREARPANKNGHTRDANLPHLRANYIRLAGRAHEPVRPEKNSPHTKTKQTYASLKESCGRSGGPKSTNRASPLRNQTFLIYFCTKLHAFIFLMHAYYACHDQHQNHWKIWQESRTQIFNPTITNWTNMAPIWHEAHIHLANAECSILFTTYSSCVPQLNFFAYMRWENKRPQKSKQKVNFQHFDLEYSIKT